MTFRILFTASRRCTEHHRPAIRQALIDEAVTHGVEPHQVVVVHGGQGYRRDGKTFGGDLIADEEATRLGMRTEPHPADWDTCLPGCEPGHRKIRYDGTEYCPTAGFRRGLPLGTSPGTRDCMRQADSAGIPVRLILPLLVTS